MGKYTYNNQELYTNYYLILKQHAMLSKMCRVSSVYVSRAD